jgi:hypothetical protein
MNEPIPASGSPVLQYQAVSFADFEVSWSGENPLGPGLCFGSEDGRMILADEGGIPLGEPELVSDSESAINGIARSGTWVAAATREEVNLLELAGPSEGGKVRGVVVPHGAHGVGVLSSGGFLAPLGRTGIMFAKPGAGPANSVMVSSGTKEGMYFYRVIGLRGSDGGDLVVCAGRAGGIGIMPFRWGEDSQQLATFTFDQLDVVDVCPIGSGSDSRAVAAVGRDGTIILIRDAARDRSPVTYKFERLVGVVYRLLSAKGHLFLLTNKGIFVLARLASRFLDGTLTGGVETPVLFVPLEAVDANLIRGRWLLIVMPGEVLRSDIELLDQSIPEGLKRGDIQAVRPRTITPAWRHSGVQLVPAS